MVHNQSLVSLLVVLDETANTNNLWVAWETLCQLYLNVMVYSELGVLLQDILQPFKE